MNDGSQKQAAAATAPRAGAKEGPGRACNQTTSTRSHRRRVCSHNLQAEPALLTDRFGETVKSLLLTSLAKSRPSLHATTHRKVAPATANRKTVYPNERLGKLRSSPGSAVGIGGGTAGGFGGSSTGTDRLCARVLGLLARFLVRRADLGSLLHALPGRVALVVGTPALGAALVVGTTVLGA